ncbi:VanZ family protein [Caloramator sp. mosi_1]|nr:VanZ family protein [Caloramator sp. mosi_1]WDC84212.1 VanZ family protein [Caloramator sp. mosi_1]
MLLGILTYTYLKHTKTNNKFLIAFLICFVYAASDEFHQYFVPGRGPRVKDVLIDSLGAIVGIGLIKIFNWKHKSIMVK